jgi:hypothetical protein
VTVTDDLGGTTTQAVNVTLAEGGAEPPDPDPLPPTPPPDPTVDVPPPPAGEATEPPVEPTESDGPGEGREPSTEGEVLAADNDGRGTPQKHGPVSLPEPLAIDELMLSVLSDREAPETFSNELPKPTPETAKSFLQELKSFWVADEANTIRMPLHQSQEFQADLERMAADLDESMEEHSSQMQLNAEAAAGVGITLTAGFVSWALRAGSMAASFLAAMPTWRHFDPMPVLAADDEEKRRSEAVDGDADAISDEERKEAKVNALFDR